LVLVVVILAFGLSPATLALWLWKRSLVVLFIVGSVLACVIEGLSAVILGYGRSFEPGFPLAVGTAFWRTVVLGLGGGLFVLVAYTITHWIFVSITKPNKDKACYEEYRPEHVQIETIPDPFDEIRKELIKNPAKKQEVDKFYKQLKPKGKRLLLSVDGGGAKGLERALEGGLGAMFLHHKRVQQVKDERQKKILAKVLSYMANVAQILDFAVTAALLAGQAVTLLGPGVV
jgi:hypothetical protein